MIDIITVIKKLSAIRPVFHSEADFQFALSWQIQQMYPSVDIRLEVPCGTSVKGRIDIVVRTQYGIIPIELKYPKRKLRISDSGELFNLAEGAHDIDMYGCMKDIARLERFQKEMNGVTDGYAIWLTNDMNFWKPEYNASYYAAFHAPQDSVKSGTMSFLPNCQIVSDDHYKTPITLAKRYLVDWNLYSDLGVKNGLFKFAVVSVQ